VRQLQHHPADHRQRLAQGTAQRVPELIQRVHNRRQRVDNLALHGLKQRHERSNSIRRHTRQRVLDPEEPLADLQKHIDKRRVLLNTQRLTDLGVEVTSPQQIDNPADRLPRGVKRRLQRRPDLLRKITDRRQHTLRNRIHQPRQHRQQLRANLDLQRLQAALKAFLRARETLRCLRRQRLSRRLIPDSRAILAKLLRTRVRDHRRGTHRVSPEQRGERADLLCLGLALQRVLQHLRNLGHAANVAVRVEKRIRERLRFVHQLVERRLRPRVVAVRAGQLHSILLKLPRQRVIIRAGRLDTRLPQRLHRRFGVHGDDAEILHLHHGFAGLRGQTHQHRLQRSTGIRTLQAGVIKRCQSRNRLLQGQARNIRRRRALTQRNTQRLHRSRRRIRAARQSRSNLPRILSLDPERRQTLNHELGGLSQIQATRRRQRQRRLERASLNLSRRKTALRQLKHRIRRPLSRERSTRTHIDRKISQPLNTRGTLTQSRTDQPHPLIKLARNLSGPLQSPADSTNRYTDTGTRDQRLSLLAKRAGEGGGGRATRHPHLLSNRALRAAEARH